MTQTDFVKLVMPFKDKVYRLAKRLLVSNEEAEDATQEILMKLWRNNEKKNCKKNAMKIFKLCLLLLVALSLTNCFEDRDDDAVAASEINDFIWKAMNATYLYKAEIPDLANTRFTSDSEYRSYLNQFSTPEAIFESLLFDPDVVDRFSFLIPNYIDFLQGQEGTTLTSGLEFKFEFKQGSDTDGYLIVRLVLNNSVADNLGVQRGQIVDAINGTPITINNVFDLVGQTTLTLNFANYNNNGTPNDDTDDTIDSTTDSVTLTKQVYTENPVHLVDIIDVDGENVGYLVYNGFNNSFETELNAAFAEFQANNVQHLVLDLRYNPGGVVTTASYLGSMITGQFNGEIFSKLVFNEDLQQNNANINFVNNFDGTPINSLNLDRVYVLTTRSSASASELVINSLDEYIEVIQVGDNTIGKTQASRTFFDSSDLGPNNINPNHTYAVQPLIANSINVNDVAVPPTGITPEIFIEEFPGNYGVLGDINEPLLAAAIMDIQGLTRLAQPIKTTKRYNGDINHPNYRNGLYIDLDLSIDKLNFELK